MSEHTEEFDVVVVGAGVSGIYALHHLRELGFTVHVIEAGDGVGGTWYWNRYPGARCDVPSMEYSYGFSPELEQEWEWTEVFPAQEEIERYLNHVADRFDLRRDIQLGTRVTAATYDEARHAVAGRDRSRTTASPAQFCVMATGCLSAPLEPGIPGMRHVRRDHALHQRLAARAVRPRGRARRPRRHRVVGRAGDARARAMPPSSTCSSARRRTRGLRATGRSTPTCSGR